MKKILIGFLALGALVSFKDKNEENKLTENETVTKTISQTNSAESGENWQYLFDGTNAEGWRGYNSKKDGLPPGWVVENGTLNSLGKGGDIGGDIVYANEEFDEFELYLEWKISEEGNSGIFYHIVEGEKYNSPYYTAPEYQVIDQLGFSNKLEPWQSIGADYGMYNPQYDDEDLKEAENWNSTRIRFTKDKVTYWLNEKKTVEFEPWSQDWEKRKEKGKWKDFPEYGKAKAGLIGLQDHGSYTWFRNIKVRKL